MAERIIRLIAKFLEQGIAAILKFLETVWSWSFGQIFMIFHSDWQALPIWKIILLMAVVGGIIYLLYKAALDIWDAARDLFSAFIGLLGAFVSALPYVVGAGLAAFAGGWIIQQVNF